MAAQLETTIDASRFKLWADRDGNAATIRCERQEHAQALHEFLAQHFTSIELSEPQPDDDESIWSIRIEFNDEATPFQVREALEGCPLARPMRLFDVTVTEQLHFLVRADDLAAWVEAQGEDVWWTADGDPWLMSRLSFPAPPDELAAALRQNGRSLLVADPQKSATDQELTAGEIDRATESDEWGERSLYLRWEGSDVDWLLIEDGPVSDSSSGP
jgi:hypothetical protein